jgi:hypothetical protein
MAVGYRSGNQGHRYVAGLNTLCVKLFSDGDAIQLQRNWRETQPQERSTAALSIRTVAPHSAYRQLNYWRRVIA